MGLESISDPEEEPVHESDDDDDSLPEVPAPDGVIELDDDDEGERYYDTRSGSTSSASASGHTSQGSREADTEDSEDPLDPITPGAAQTRFDIADSTDSFVDASEENVIEDDWIDPTPLATSSPNGKSRSISSEKKSTSSSSTKKKHKHKQKPVPVPRMQPPPSKEHYPFPVTREDRMASDSPMMADWGDGIPQGKRMHTARARDGGRTQSGGVRGVLTED